MIQLERTAQLWGITGNLGGGKTLTAVNFAVEAMRDGYFVCTNITLKIDVIAAYYGEYVRKLYQHISLDDSAFDPFKLPCGSPRGSGGKKRVLVILDECAEWVDQYSSAKDPRISRLWSWLRHSSKRSQDVFIIVQRPDYLNKVIRILVSRWIWVNDLAVYRLPYIKMKFPFCGGLIIRNVYDQRGNRIAGMTFASKSFWGQFYNTAECLNSDGATYTFEYEKPPIKNNSLVWLLLVLLFSQYYLYRSICRFIESSKVDALGNISVMTNWSFGLPPVSRQRNISQLKTSETFFKSLGRPLWSYHLPPCGCAERAAGGRVADLKGDQRGFERLG